MIVFAWIAISLALLGVLQSAIGYALVRRFRAAASSPVAAGAPVSVLKPLYGAEPLLEEALASLCRQDHACYQIVCGVHDAADPALAAVRRVQARFPDRDIVIVVDPRSYGCNGKVSNLVNMLPHARHDILVIADSDVHSAPDYLSQIVGALQQDGVGLVTAVYAGLAASATVVGALGATAITHQFLPGALLGRALGRQDCLGATMALRRTTLDAIGGFRAIADEVADDAVLGQRVRALGLAVALAPTVPVTTVPEQSLLPLFAHERRWGRTILSVAPLSFALSSIQYSLVWALLAVLASAGGAWACLAFAAVWAVRSWIGHGIDRSLGLARAGAANPLPIWLLPLRDLLSMAVLVASYASPEVRWRGEVLTIRTGAAHMVPVNSDTGGD